MEQITKNKVVSIIFILFYLSGTSHAQNFGRYDVEVKRDGSTLKYATIGGLIAPQFSSIDLNGDGVLDLFVFDRVGSVVRTFVHTGKKNSTDYRYAPEYESAFPKLTEFALLRDFNNDGKEDIFTLSSQGIPGVEVWKNTSTDGKLSFELVKSEGRPYDVLYYKLKTGGSAQLYVSNIDVPAIVDIDNDGDLDILTFDNGGGNKVYYFKNFAVEAGKFPATPFLLRQENSCYGLMFESSFSQKMYLSKDGKNCATEDKTPARPLHAGSTITTLDANHDGAIDLLIGDLTSSSIVYLENGRTSNDAWMNKIDASFPSYNIPIKMPYFPSTFYLDVNNDGKKDLIACPNNNLSSENKDHIWLYLNKGVGRDSFVLEQKDFLIDQGLSYGTVSDFAFLDYNADGLLDLLMGTDVSIKNQKKTNSLVLFQNTGTPTTPVYTIVDEDYLGMSSLNNANRRLSPAVGDIDGDGDDDILVGIDSGILYYYDNSGGKGNPMKFDNYKYKYMNIDPGLWAKPMIYDLNGDGLNDILCGEKNDNSDDGRLGSVNYYENIGSVGNPMFDPNPKAGNNTSALGGMFTKDPGISATGAASPFIIKTKEGTRAVIGSRSGRIRVYGNIDGNQYGVYKKLLDSIPLPLQGDLATVALADINNDKYYEMVVGNERGGLAFFTTPYQVDSTSSTIDMHGTDVVRIYPNPVRDQLYIESRNGQPAKVDVYTTLGQVVLSDTKSVLDVSSLLPGSYILRMVNQRGEVGKQLFVKY